MKKKRGRRPGLSSADALARASRKLREARFFLGQMTQTEQKGEAGMVTDPEAFQFFLSAFQGAARSVIQTLEAGRLGQTVNQWRDELLEERDRALVEFMTEERDSEVHRAGTTEQAAVEMVPVTELQQATRAGQPSPGFHFSHAAYGYTFTPGTPPPRVGVRRHSYAVDGTPERVTDTAGRYLALLDKLVDLAQPKGNA
jgi:hypothetical protein